VIADPGAVRCSLVELLAAALAHGGAREITLSVRAEGTDAVVAATGGGELRLPAAEVAA
jgi:hypothetical protein